MLGRDRETRVKVLVFGEKISILKLLHYHQPFFRLFDFVDLIELAPVILAEAAELLEQEKLRLIEMDKIREQELLANKQHHFKSTYPFANLERFTKNANQNNHQQQRTTPRWASFSRR